MNSFPVRDVDEIEFSGFYTKVKTISAVNRLPVEAHLPAVKVPVKSKVGVSYPFGQEIVTEVADGDAPVGCELYVAPA